MTTKTFPRPYRLSQTPFFGLTGNGLACFVIIVSLALPVSVIPIEGRALAALIAVLTWPLGKVHSARFAGFPLVMLGASLVATTTSQSVRNSMGVCVAAGTVLVVALYFLKTRPRLKEQKRHILIALNCLIAAGALLDPGSIGRLSFPLRNPNSAGLLLALFAISQVDIFPKHRVLALATTSLILLTGSRSAMLAFCIGACAYYIRKNPRLGKKQAAAIRVGLLLISSYLILKLASANLPEQALESKTLRISRQNDSRTDFWNEAIQSLNYVNPLFGHGPGNAPNFTVNSLIHSVVELGVILGLLGPLTLVALTFRHRNIRTPNTDALLISALISSVFESWLFAPSSPFTAIFLALLATTLKPKSSSLVKQSAIDGNL